jgi:hypothetical protein
MSLRRSPAGDDRVSDTTSPARGRGVAVAAIVVVAGVIALYAFLIAAESDNDAFGVALVVLYLLVPIAGLVGALTLGSASARGVAGAGAAGLLLSMGVLAIFSIGLLVLVGAVLAIVWVVRTQPEREGTSPLPTVAAFVVGAILPWSLPLLG